MPDLLRHPTRYLEVNNVLFALQSSIQSILGDYLIGIYLYGSLATGDFNLETSDIDFLVATSDELPREMLVALEEMHTRIAASGSKWARKLEGSYIPQRALRRYDPTCMMHPSIGVEWPFGIGPHGVDWVIQRHILREQGVALSGPAPQSMIDPVSPDELRQAVAGTLKQWWAPQLQESLRPADYQAYATLTMCRALYTLQYGTIVSKPVAARWAQEKLGQPWVLLIEEALAWRPGEPLLRSGEMLDLIRYTLTVAG